MLTRSLTRYSMPRMSRTIAEYAGNNVEDIISVPNMNEDDLKFVSKELGKPYLGVTSDRPTFPVPGIIYTRTNGIRCVSLIVQKNDIKVWIPFVINSGSPVTVIGKPALEALQFELSEITDSTNFTIHGFESAAATHIAADARLKNLNILGWSFFRDTGVFEAMNAENMTLSLYKDKKQFIDACRGDIR